MQITRFHKTLLIAIAMLFGMADLAMSQVPGYGFRKKYRVNSAQVSGVSVSSHTNFPVLVSLTDADFRTTGNGGDVQNANGFDIVITSDNGTSILSHQIETYVATTGEIEFWVRFPTLSATVDTEFYIYYGNAAIASDPSTTNVWDSNYKLVSHMNNNADDASGNGTDGVETGIVDFAGGQIGRARSYNSIGDIIQVPDPGSSPLDITGNITVSFWVRITNLASGPDLMTKGDYLDGYSFWVTGAGNLRFQINNDVLAGSANNQIANNVWSYLTFTRSLSGRAIYVNGALDNSDASTTSFNTNDDPFFMSTLAFDYLGAFDEVRVSDVTRDADWIQTEFNNQNAPGTFITQINAEPLMSAIEGSATTFNSGDSPLAITATLDIDDADDTNMESATVEITGNFNTSEDVLGFVDQNGITGSYSSLTGILTLTGTSTTANYITALRSVTYQNTNGSPDEITRTVTYTVNDGTDASNTQTRDITIVRVNNAPVLSNLEAAPIVVFQGDPAEAITTTLDISDIDNTTIASASVQITTNYQNGEDILAFVDQLGITGTFTAGTGTMDLTGTTTIANYETAIRSITYQNTGAPPTMSTRTFTIIVNDGAASSIGATRDIEIATALTEPSSDFSNTVFHFDAQDADGDGNTGTNQPADGLLTTWGDRSQNAGNSTVTLDFAANNGAETPTLNANFFGERGGIQFITDDYYDRNTDNAILNTSTFTEKSFAFVIRTGTDITSTQVIYEQGGATRGYIFAVQAGSIFATRYDRNLAGTVNDYSSIEFTGIEANTTYVIIATHDATGGDTDWRANINGGAITELTNAPQMNSHSGNAAIGETEANQRNPNGDDTQFSSGLFNGFMAELIQWNTVLTTTDFTNLYAYLSDRWFNVPPVVENFEASAITFNEGDPATAISTTLTVSDVDNTVLDSAKVSITSGFNSAEDVLALPAPVGGITGSYNSTTGVLTLSGNSSLANYQTALRSVTYQNTDAVSPDPTTRVLDIVVFDWDDPSGAAMRDINVIPNNDAPVIAAIEGSVLAYTEGDGAVAISSTITATDSDDTNLESATIQITGNYFLGEDVLSFANANGIAGSFTAGTGTLTLTGTSSVANYQAALRDVRYENISGDPVTGLNRTVSFTVNDGDDNSTTITRDISVASVNTAPTLSGVEASLLVYTTGDTLDVTNTILITDPDDTNIDTAFVQITGNYDSSQDTLVFSDIFGITGVWTDGTGLLTLEGPATIADFQDALRTVGYANTSSNPSTPERTISITIDDGTDNSNTVTRNVSVSVVPTIPNLTLWLKGDAGTFDATVGGSASTNGGIVRRWEDQSGNGNHFITAGTAPVFQSSVGTINSQSAVEFPGGASVRLEDADAETQYLNGLTEFTMFIVIESDDVDTDQGFFTAFEPDGDDKFFSLRYDDVGTVGAGTNVITAALREDLADFQLESFEDAQTTSGQIIALQWETEETYDLYVDGVLNNPSASALVPTGLITNATTAIIGQGPLDTGANSWDGLIAEVILYSRSLSNTERQDIEDYLNTKYSIPIRLLTTATGGEAISADDSALPRTYTTLTGPRIQESFAGELTASGTIILEAPTGFEWDTGGGTPSVSILPAFGGGTDLAVTFTSRTSSQITFTVNTASNGTLPNNNPGEITFSNLRIAPTTGTLPNTGDITNVGTTGPGGNTNYGTVTMVPGTRITMEYAQQPSTTNVNTDITPAVRVQFVDQFGNAVQDGDQDVTISKDSGPGTLTGTLTRRTNSFGIAEFSDLELDATGTYALRAASAALTDIVSDNFDVVVLGQLTQFRVERVPSGNISAKTAGTEFNIVITAIDGIGATVPGFTGTVVISSNCTLGTGSGTTASFVAGVLSSHTVSITNVDNCSITATNSLGAETGSSNTFAVSAGAASEAVSPITASPTVIINDGFSTSTITADLTDAFGNDITSGGATVVFSTNLGTVGSTTDNGDGSYTATLTSSITLGTATVTATLDGNGFTDNAQVQFAAFNAIWQSQIGAIPDARNWDDATNWSSGVVPTSGDNVLIPATPSVGNQFPVIDTDNLTISELSIEPSATLTVSGSISFTITNGVSGSGQILGTNTDTVSIGGDINVGDIGLGNVIYNGTANQDLTSPHTYNNLELNNSNGLDASQDLTVTGTLRLTSGTLLIPSGTSLIANTKIITSGNLRFQREITGVRGWRLISSPVASTFGDLLDGTITQGYTGAFYPTGALPGDTLQSNVLYYDETFPGTDNQRYRAPGNATDNLTPGQGMFVFFFGDVAGDTRYNDPLPDTLDVTGQENEGAGSTLDFGITYTALADTGFNLIGNPYGATIDWDDPSWTKTNVENTIYVWDPAANGGNGEYLTWNGTTGTLGSGLIPPFQGFWVKATGPGPSLIVSEDAKTNGGNFLRKANIDETPPIIRMRASAAGLEKQTSIQFTTTADIGKDLSDAFELTPFSASRIDFSTQLPDGTPVAINNLPLDFTNRYLIPIDVNGFVEGEPIIGEFELTLLGLRNVPEDWVINLIDNDTGEEIDLTEQFTYTFNHTTREKFAAASPNQRGAVVKQKSRNTPRFTLLISTEDIEANIPREAFLDQNFPNPFNPSTTIQFGLNEDSDVVLEVFDILGRRIQTLANTRFTAGLHQVRFDARRLASGVYIYRLKTDSRTFTRKLTFIK